MHFIILLIILLIDEKYTTAWSVRDNCFSDLNGLWSKRRQTKTATSQNGDKPKRRQVHGEITKTATNQKVDIATQYERVKE